MKSISSNQEMGDTERLLCPGAPQDPARFQDQRLFASIPMTNFFTSELIS